MVSETEEASDGNKGDMGQYQTLKPLTLEL